MANNRLAGQIPVAMSAWRSLHSVTLRFNQLSGPEKCIDSQRCALRILLHRVDIAKDYAAIFSQKGVTTTWQQYLCLVVMMPYAAMKKQKRNVLLAAGDGRLRGCDGGGGALSSGQIPDAVGASWTEVKDTIDFSSNRLTGLLQE